VTERTPVDWAYIRRMTWWLVPLGFLGLDLVVLAKYVEPSVLVGFDASLYAEASRAWLEGTDPWQVSQQGIFYGAPPPTLVPFALFAFLPGIVTSLIWIIGSAALAALAIRALRLAWWWLAFPPIVDSVLVGNPDVAVLAALVVAGGRLDVVAPFLKIYALVPMVGERRWRSVVVCLAALAASLLVLPWSSWIAQLPAITANLATTSETTSVYGQPVLMLMAVVVLLALGLRRAGWLSVPLLWPHTQLHYLAISVPGLTPFLALAWCFPTPEMLLLSTAVFALIETVRHTLGRRATETSHQPTSVPDRA
jgi:hypothetical protein